MTEPTAQSVAIDLDHHQEICAERYKRIDQSLNELKAMVLTQGTDMHMRLNTISSRMWFAVTGCLGAAVIGLGAIVFHLLTRGHP